MLLHMEDYVILSPIGTGAYGYVCLCERKSDKKKAAMKKIDLENLEDANKFQNEISILSLVRHPHVIEYYDHFMDSTGAYIVMEYAAGGNLLQYLKSRSSLLPEKQVWEYFTQLCAGLQFIHHKQILHRDLKSSNILLNHSHTLLKIGDFGVSKILENKSNASSVVGTASYVSPEICHGLPYDQKSDVWALGCVLYELLTLKKAFEAEALLDMVKKIDVGAYDPVSVKYSDDLREMLSRLFCVDREARPYVDQIVKNYHVFTTMLRLMMNLGAVHV